MFLHVFGAAFLSTHSTCNMLWHGWVWQGRSVRPCVCVATTVQNSLLRQPPRDGVKFRGSHSLLFQMVHVYSACCCNNCSKNAISFCLLKMLTTMTMRREAAHDADDGDVVDDNDADDDDDDFTPPLE